MEQSNNINLNFHRQKLYALIAAIVGFIAVFLPWYKMTLNLGFNFGGRGQSINGLRDMGIIAFLGFIAAGVVTFAMGDKTKPYAGDAKMIAGFGFAAAGLFTLITFLQQTRFTSFGIYMSLIAGIAGTLLVFFIKPEQLELKS
jgi:hypothetical protein